MLFCFRLYSWEVFRGSSLAGDFIEKIKGILYTYCEKIIGIDSVTIREPNKRNRINEDE